MPRQRRAPPPPRRPGSAPPGRALPCGPRRGVHRARLPCRLDKPLLASAVMLPSMQRSGVRLLLSYQRSPRANAHGEDVLALMTVSGVHRSGHSSRCSRRQRHVSSAAVRFSP